MDRALAYLLLMRLKNTLLGVVRKPTRLIGVLLLLGAFVAMIVARSLGDGGGQAEALVPGLVLVAVLGLYLVLAVLGGIGEPGLGFLPADLDYVLPGPFRKRQILIYHLGRQYGQILLLALLYVLFLGGANLPRYDLAYLGTILCLAVAAHLQAASTLVAGQVGDRVFGRLRRASRTGLIVVLVIAALIAIVGVAGASDVPGVLQRVMTSSVTRVLLYPAIAAGQVAASPSLAAAAPHLLGLLACAVATFGLVLLFPLNVMETTYVTAVDRRRRLQEEGAPKGASRSTRGGVPGAGAVAWLNAVILRRRLRMVVGLVAMLLVILLVSSTQRREGSSMPSMVGILAFFPVIANLPLGFRGHRDHLELLKTLPVSALALAAAQVAVPVMLIYGSQALVVVIFTILGKIELAWSVAALLALPVFDVGVVALVDTFQLDRDPRQAGFLWVTLQMLMIVVTVLPAIIVGVLLAQVTDRPQLGILAGLLIHAAVAYGLLRLLAWRFKAWEPGKDAV